MNYLRHRNIPIFATKITKLMPEINELSVSIYLSMPTTKTKLVKDDWILVGYLKLFRFMSVMMVQAKCKLTKLTYSSNCSIFSAKKLETKSTTKKQKNLKNGKLRFRLNIDVRKDKEDSWLNAIKTKIAFVNGGLNLTSKIRVQQQPMFTLWNWLKSNHITVDIIYCLRSLLVCGFFYEF